MTMPKLDLSNLDLTPEELALAQQIVKPNGTIYASKPTKAEGEAKYLWRMVVFTASPNPKHWCLPVCADFDLDGKFSETRETAARLDKLADRLLKAIPLEEHHGTMVWGTVLGAF